MATDLEAKLQKVEDSKQDAASSLPAHTLASPREVMTMKWILHSNVIYGVGWQGTIQQNSPLTSPPCFWSLNGRTQKSWDVIGISALVDQVLMNALNTV